MDATRQTTQRTCRRSWPTRWLSGSWVDLIYLPNCVVCRHELHRDEREHSICNQCRQRLASPASQLCQTCGCSLPTLSISTNQQVAPCRSCLDQSAHFDRIVCLGPYRDLLRDAIVRMKHAGQQSLSFALGRMLGGRVLEVLGSQYPDALVPLPMHWSRRLMRGTATSQMLAEGVSQVTRIPRINQSIKCCRRTQKQSTLTPPQRRENVKHAFSVHRPRKIEGKHIAIVDDTLTTGATVNEAARVLLAAGACRVSVFVLARATSR